MLTLLIGRAGTGKTEHIMNEIKRKMDSGETGMLLIVPEQYSHDAERQLCAICGDRLSLYAETLSFTRLCNNVLSEAGEAGSRSLDASGQILAMHRALESVAPSLKVFGIKRMRTEILERLLEAIKEFKSLNIAPQTLENASNRTRGPLSEKLKDLALIFDAYDTLLQVHGSDTADRLTLLADFIGESSVGNTGHIYFDGFNDFTIHEICVIEELLRKKAKITVCLTYDPDDDGEIFKIPQKTAAQLSRLAEDHGVRLNQEYFLPEPTPLTQAGRPTASTRAPEPHAYLPTASTRTPEPHADLPNASTRAPELIFLEKHLFSDAPPKYPGQCNAITVYAAPTHYVECEYAAYKVWELVRNGSRWRDIGVMARDWEEYGSICENVFEKYGVPFFSGGKADILTKPPITLIDAALEIATSGWEYRSIFRYLKSGLLDIMTDQCALLENYVLRWQIRGSLWTREWTMPPYGYSRKKDDDEEHLKQINELRKQLIKPLTNLRDGIKGESNAEVKLRALYRFLEEIKLPEHLAEKAREFNERGEMRLADEYVQLWDITINAMEQMNTILGDDKLSAIEFRKLFTLALSQNDVGVIPVSLDRTALGGMAMSRRRDLKCLIILGATDENLPTLSKNTGALSDHEKALLRKLGTDIPAGLEDRLYREMNMLYSTLTLPSDKLVVIYPTSAGQRPSFIIKRLTAMFDKKEETLSADEYMTAAEVPYLELLRSKGQPVSYPGNTGTETASLTSATTLAPNQPTIQPTPTYKQNRNLSRQAAAQLYGKEFSLSATRVDRYYACPYKHFLQNGLRLEPRIPAEFDAAAAGIFMHYVLDGVFCEIKEGEGFKDIKEESYLKLTNKYIGKYVDEVLLNFEGKNKRFEYLFRRYQEDVIYVVSDMIEELRRSGFEPLDLELDMSTLSAAERGLIDRVDGFTHEGKLLLRVIDYKTRNEAYSFDLTDVLYGRDMQMLIYLFALEKYGNVRYDAQIEPAGVLYVPARDVILNAPRNASQTDIRQMRKSEMRRSGLILNDPDVLEAMESGAEKDYLPVKTTKEGEIIGDSLISSKQIEVLSKHVSNMMQNAKEKIKSGDNECVPYYKSANDNACSYCEFHTVCGFDEETGDKRRVVSRKKPEDVWEAME